MQEKSTYVALGANLHGPGGASPLETCSRALAAIHSLAGVHTIIRSRWFSSASVPASDQPRYINGIARLTCSLSPTALLDMLNAIERQFGRVRGMVDAARTLDLDIVDMQGQVRASPDPVLPHPRAHLRGFVLRPLRDVAPRWVHPGLSIGIDELIAGLSNEDTRPL